MSVEPAPVASTVHWKVLIVFPRVIDTDGYREHLIEAIPSGIVKSVITFLGVAVK